MIFASGNNYKVKQIKDLCKGKVDICGLKDVNISIEVEEDGATFEENAKKKALAIFNLTHEEVLADDSGLCIDIFDGWPGVYTHRFIPNSTAEERNKEILEKMQNVDDSLRGAKNICVLCYCNKQGETKIYKGVVKGSIAKSPKGDNVFGFDPIFLLENNKTLAELSDEEKITVNARSLAFKAFLQDYEEQKR